MAVEEKTLSIPRLPPALEGLRITHLSDVHLTGRIDRRYFEEAFKIVNGARPDLIILTGDLIEKDACRPWVPSTFGRLKAEHGVYFVHQHLRRCVGGEAPGAADAWRARRPR